MNLAPHMVRGGSRGAPLASGSAHPVFKRIHCRSAGNSIWVVPCPGRL